MPRIDASSGLRASDAARELPADPAGDAGLADFYQTLSTPSRHLIQREQVEHFERAMEALPAHYREVILLSRVVGMPIAEVAAALDRTEEATRSLMRRALAVLADALERHG